MTKRDLLALEDWPTEQIDAVLELARRIKQGKVTGGLERRMLGLVFLSPDEQTRISFEAAMFLHGGAAVTLQQGESWRVATGSAVMDGTAQEHVLDTARVLDRMVDAVAVRPFQSDGDWATARQDQVLRSFALTCSRPVINLGSARRHPCQALADTLTLQEQLGRVEGKRFVLTWAWHPRPLSTAVPASAALAAARLGMEIVIARPEGYELDPEDTALVRRTAQQAGGEFVHISDDPDDALVGADAVYVASWGAVKLFGQPEKEQETRAGLRDWRLSSSRLRSTRGGKGIVLHAFPYRRNVEIDDKVLESANAAVIDQAENRLYVQRAVLLELMRDPERQ
jgi:N-acetylornithine carbamoyltransferase